MTAKTNPAAPKGRSDRDPEPALPKFNREGSKYPYNFKLSYNIPRIHTR